MPLEEYRRKRDFERTPEPAGEPARAKDPGLRYLIQKHDASHLHYDLRLELDGVLKSWAVPKGPSLDPADKRLAMEVEDHPIEYGDFEGVIPEGEYGGGTVMLWDRGTWEPVGDAAAGLANGDLKFRIDGERLTGEWAIVRMKRRANEKRDSWLLIKHRDASARPRSDVDVTAIDTSVATGRTMSAIREAGDTKTGNPDAEEPGPPGFQLATAADRAPDGPGWLHEIKLDGYRAWLQLAPGGVTMRVRSGGDWTDRFRPLAEAARELPARSALLDGEVVALDKAGVSSFSALQKALSAGPASALTFFAFDVVERDGRDLSELPLLERKRQLADLLGGAPAGSPIRYLDHVLDSGALFHARTCELALEGSVSKRADRPRREGRSRDWVKVKCLGRSEFVVAGWTDPRGSRVGFGALLLAEHDAEGALRYAGRVGTGFSDSALTSVRERLDALAVADPPLVDPPRVAGAHWVRPELVAEVTYLERTRDGLLRQPSFLGLREDKPAAEVVRERPGPPESEAPRLTNPDRVLWSEDGITKRMLADYHRAVAPASLPHLTGRLITLVRCPSGYDGECFYQKHAERSFPSAVRRVKVPTRQGDKEFLVADDLAGVLALVQMGTLEVHTWGSSAEDPEHPDRLTFDLDPGPDVPWDQVVATALTARDALAEAGLASFVKTTGGRGLHVVAPVVPDRGWDEVHTFAKAFADAMAAARPDRYTASIKKSRREGRVLVDYVRNSREATAVAAYSPRARTGAPVSVPLTWDELTSGVDPGAFTVRTVPARVSSLKRDPWSGYDDARSALPRA